MAYTHGEYREQLTLEPRCLRLHWREQRIEGFAPEAEAASEFCWTEVCIAFLHRVFA